MFSARQASVIDANVIGDIMVRSAAFAYAEIASPEYLEALDPAKKAAEYQLLLPLQRNGHYAVFLAEDDNVPMGFAEIEMSETATPGKVGVLQRMFFAPESLGRGLGSILHNTVVAEFARWGCTEAELTYVRGNERARSFYLKHAWTETGENRPFDDHGRALFDIVMRRLIQ